MLLVLDLAGQRHRERHREKCRNWKEYAVHLNWWKACLICFLEYYVDRYNRIVCVSDLRVLANRSRGAFAWIAGAELGM